MIAKDVDGRIMAGRCISGDVSAHPSYRVTGFAAQPRSFDRQKAALAAEVPAASSLRENSKASRMRFSWRACRTLLVCCVPA